MLFQPILVEVTVIQRYLMPAVYGFDFVVVCGHMTFFVWVENVSVPVMWCVNFDNNTTNNNNSVFTNKEYHPT